MKLLVLLLAVLSLNLSADTLTGIKHIYVDVHPLEPQLKKVSVSELKDRVELALQREGVRITAEADKNKFDTPGLAFLGVSFTCLEIESVSLIACSVVATIDRVGYVRFHGGQADSEILQLARSGSIATVHSSKADSTWAWSLLESSIVDLLNRWRKANPKP